MTAFRTDGFDCIIIDAGSAGWTLANRLSADPDVRVLLLEAGGWDRNPFVKLPLGRGKVPLNRIYDCGHDGEPQEAMAGRRIECARQGCRRFCALIRRMSIENPLWGAPRIHGGHDWPGVALLDEQRLLAP